MSRYRVYGSILESAVPFPDLPTASAADGSPRWRIEQHESLPPMQDESCLGAERLYDDVHARLFAHRDGWRIVVDDTGAFDLGDAGLVRAAPRADAWDDFVRAHLLGRVLATLQYRDGWLPLHASAVATTEGTIAFLGPKGVGKTSLAAALVQAGAPLVSDDTLPIEPSAPPRAHSGVRTLRVRDDVREQLALGDVGERTREGKRAVNIPKGTYDTDTPRPLAAIFLIAPSSVAVDLDAVHRTPYAPVLAAAAVTAHVKCGAMLGSAAAGDLLARAARIVHHVPVNQLSVTRDVARLPEAAATILGWYGGPPR